VSSHHIEHVDTVTPSIGLFLLRYTLYRVLHCDLARRSGRRGPFFIDGLYDSEAERPLSGIAQIQDIIYLTSYGIVSRPLFESHQHMKRNPEPLGYSTYRKEARFLLATLYLAPKVS
jgi:hypothetical protein